MLLAHGLTESMVARGRGHLLFMSSLSGRAASPGTSVYAATKFGLRGFALALREDLAPKGVGVSVILPGFISDAGMFADSGAKLPPFVGTKRPEDVARAVVKAIESQPRRARRRAAAAARRRAPRRPRPRADRHDPAQARRHRDRGQFGGPGRQALARLGRGALGAPPAPTAALIGGLKTGSPG